MAKLAVNPNRMELLKLKKRHTFAIRGHKLLKDKQETLMQMFMGILRELQTMYQELETDLNSLYETYYMAQVSGDPYALEEALESPARPLALNVTFKHQLGGRLPSFELTDIDTSLRSSAATAPLAVPQLFEQLKTTLPRLIKLVQIEKQLEILAEDIEKTRRRVNALEYNLIPSISETVHSIVMKLEERDRFERVTLMKVKERMERS